MPSAGAQLKSAISRGDNLISTPSLAAHLAGHTYTDRASEESRATGSPHTGQQQQQQQQQHWLGFENGVYDRLTPPEGLGTPPIPLQPAASSQDLGHRQSAVDLGIGLLVAGAPLGVRKLRGIQVCWPDG
jgi:hypothetical protein